jgi:Integrase zinc binding domain
MYRLNRYRQCTESMKVKQLCLPIRIIPTVLEMGHDASFVGYTAFQATRRSIKLSFWFPTMDTRIRSYCSSCAVCHLHHLSFRSSNNN